MTLAEIIRAQLATGRPLRVTRALLEALDAGETDAAVMASLRVTAREYAARFPDLLYGTRTALCEALALPASTLGPAIVAAVVAIRETAKRDREERDEARAEVLAWQVAISSALDGGDTSGAEFFSSRDEMAAAVASLRADLIAARRNANAWADERDVMRRERDEARRTMLAMRRQRDDYADRLDAAQSRADERDIMRRERDEARVEVERLRAERDEASESLRLSVAAWDAAGMRGRDAASVIREAEERGARWMHAAAVECSRYIGADHAMPKLNVQRICEAARKAGEHE